MNAQFKKGVLDLCVLTLLKKKDSYGYDLAEKMAQTIEIAEGTLYPLLRKLKLDGMCETYLSEQSGGPPRKYYRLTDKGKQTQEQLRQEWDSFSNQVKALMEEYDDE